MTRKESDIEKKIELRAGPLHHQKTIYNILYVWRIFLLTPHDRDIFQLLLLLVLVTLGVNVPTRPPARSSLLYLCAYHLNTQPAKGLFWSQTVPGEKKKFRLRVSTPSEHSCTARLLLSTAERVRPDTKVANDTRSRRSYRRNLIPTSARWERNALPFRVWKCYQTHARIDHEKHGTTHSISDEKERDIDSPMR